MTDEVANIFRGSAPIDKETRSAAMGKSMESTSSLNQKSATTTSAGVGNSSFLGTVHPDNLSLQKHPCDCTRGEIQSRIHKDIILLHAASEASPPA
jgi:hypothetical protein